VQRGRAGRGGHVTGTARKQRCRVDLREVDDCQTTTAARHWTSQPLNGHSAITARCYVACLSVCLSVALVDCDHVVQQRVEIGTLQDYSVSWLPPYRSRPGSYCPVIREMEKCVHTSAASNGLHVSLSQHLMRFLFLCSRW